MKKLLFALPLLAIACAPIAGEDDVEWMMVRELRALQSGTPTDAFAYVSTNFVTNSRLTKELVKLKELGVRTRVFFDRGRFYDPMFTSQFYQLAPKMGFTKGLGSNKLSVTQGSGNTNDLSGKYGANHNKFAILGMRNAGGTYRVKLLNGSANWSGAATDTNDENLVVIEDQHAAAIYLFNAVMGQSNASCTDSTGAPWKPEPSARSSWR